MEHLRIIENSDWLPQVPEMALLLRELDRVLVGYPDLKRKSIVLLLADGHALIESVPGLGKTLFINTLARGISGATSGVMQMNPETKPTDVLGYRIYNMQMGQFEIVPGPVIGVNFFLADEVNRTSEKTNSALLSAMQERRVIIAGKVFELEDPFFVFATQNPIESEGTYPLPNAQLDRFAFKLKVTYLSEEDEMSLLGRTEVHGRNAQQLLTPGGVLTIARLKEMQQKVNEISSNASPAARKFITKLVFASRPGTPTCEQLAKVNGVPLGDIIELGASPRAGIWMQRTAAARAFLDGREAISGDDIKYVARDVLRHRIKITQEASLTSGWNVEQVLQLMLDRNKGVPMFVPELPFAK